LGLGRLSSVVCRYRFDGPFSESVLEGDLMAAVIGSIKEDLGVMGSRCEWPGEEREELVGDSTRFEGCEASLAASLARLGEKNGERESERVPKQRMTMKLLGVWDAGKGGGKKTQRSSASEQPARANGGAAGQGDWQVAGRSPMEKILHQSLVWRPSVGCRDRLSRAQRVM
jgi:hypothetical protein